MAQAPRRIGPWSLIFLGILAYGSWSSAGEKPAVLEAGFGEADITPTLGTKPVYMAGFGHNRVARAVNDPLLARAVVLRHGDQKIALVSVDLVGYFLAEVEKVRTQLPGFSYVLVSSTHNHEGPDTLGLWGKSAFESGIDRDYLARANQQIVAAVKLADSRRKPVRTRIGTMKAPELLHDGRDPQVKHDELVVLDFLAARPSEERVGLVVQWNCHPETLGSDNTLISADYVGYTVQALKQKYRCPVVYLTGTVGGLMTSLHVEVKDVTGQALADGTFEKTERYGRLLADVANRALDSAKPLTLTPLEVRRQYVYLPVDNKLYQLGRQLGVLQREAFVWTGDAHRAEPAREIAPGQRLCMKSEVAWLRLGDLDVAAIPGEIYPELVLDKVQDPPDPGADYPDAPIEPAIYKQLRGPHRMLIGLANDEIGYIIPKRQWDEKPPFCYGRKSPQYGEVNSLGPDTAPLLCNSFRDLMNKSK
jgi:hypothetical protein